MAHIPDGILSAPVLIGGALVAAGGVALGLRRLDDLLIIRAAILAAAIFAISLISIPVGPSSVHVLLAGLMGLLIGAGTFPAVLAILLLQLLLFGFGGVTTLGVNTMNIALPGVLFAMLLGPAIRRAPTAARRTILAGIVGAASALGTGMLVGLSIWLSTPEFAPIATVMVATYLPLAFGEAVITAVIVSFLARVQPETLEMVA